MIAFGCAITSAEKYERFALPGLRLAAEPDSEIVALPNEGTLSAGYNRILDQLGDRQDLEAVALLHQDLEITNPGFVGAVRRYLADSQAAILGAAGAKKVGGLTWWEPGPIIGDYEWAYERNGGGMVYMDNWTNFVHATAAHPVDAVDGMLLVLSGWAARNLRFDEDIDPGAHGYDIDICLQARDAGRSVVVGAGLGVTHHHELEVLTDSSAWIRAHVRIAEKWEGRLGIENGQTDWKRRARQAEAEAGAAKIVRDELNLLRNEADRRSLLFWERIVKLERRHEVVRRLATPVRPVVNAVRRIRDRAARESV